eukprot:1186944-Prorocentrum_minimum.AAC.4
MEYTVSPNLALGKSYRRPAVRVCHRIDCLSFVMREIAQLARIWVALSILACFFITSSIVPWLRIENTCGMLLKTFRWELSRYPLHHDGRFEGSFCIRAFSATPNHMPCVGNAKSSSLACAY